MCVPKSVLCLVAFGGLFSFPLEAGAKASAGPLQGRASVIDGDTLEVQGTRIRLFGIDAPESA